MAISRQQHHPSRYTRLCIEPTISLHSFSISVRDLGTKFRRPKHDIGETHGVSPQVQAPVSVHTTMYSPTNGGFASRRFLARWNSPRRAPPKLPRNSPAPVPRVSRFQRRRSAGRLWLWLLETFGPPRDRHATIRDPLNPLATKDVYTGWYIIIIIFSRTTTRKIFASKYCFFFF